MNRNHVDPSMGIIETTGRWFVVAGQQPNEPTYDPKQVCFYLGMQLEELTEKLALVAGEEAVVDLKAIADEFKKAPPELVTVIDDRLRSDARIAAEFLDGDCDLLWVTLGGMRALGADSRHAYGLVTLANWEKFPNGEVLRDANGKVVKPKGWLPADLTPALPAVLRGTP